MSIWTKEEIMLLKGSRERSWVDGTGQQKMIQYVETCASFVFFRFKPNLCFFSQSSSTYEWPISWLVQKYFNRLEYQMDFKRYSRSLGEKSTLFGDPWACGTWDKSLHQPHKS